MLIDTKKLESLGPDQPQAVLHEALQEALRHLTTMETWYHREHRNATIYGQGIIDIAQFKRTDNPKSDLDHVIQTAILTEAQI